jgi:hypothetical protein
VIKSTVVMRLSSQGKDVMRTTMEESYAYLDNVTLNECSICSMPPR